MSKYPTRDELSRQFLDVYLTLKGLMARIDKIALAELDRHNAKALANINPRRNKYGPGLY